MFKKLLELSNCALCSLLFKWCSCLGLILTYIGVDAALQNVKSDSRIQIIESCIDDVFLVKYLKTHGTFVAYLKNHAF